MTSPADRVIAALEVAMAYGQTDGGHHKAWVIDQMVRCLTACPTVRGTAVDANGREYTYDTLGESEQYREFIAEHNAGEDGPDTYTWDEGVAP